MDTSEHQTQYASQIRQLVDTWATTIQGEDMDGFLKHHADDTLVIDVPHALQAERIAEYKKMWEQFFSWPKNSRAFEVTGLEVTASETVAYCHGIGNCVGENQAGLKRKSAVSPHHGFS